MTASCLVSALLILGLPPDKSSALDKLVGTYSARTMSQSMPWIAQEAGLFRKYDLDLQLIYTSSASMATAALLSGDSEVAITGGEAIIRAYVQGVTDFAFIASAKNTLTHSILARPEIKSVEGLKGKKLGVSRLGSNSHYFVLQALRKKGLEAKDVNLIQTGGQAENLAALVSGAVDAATMTGPAGGTQASAHGFHYLVYGPDLRISFVAASLVTRRAMLRSRSNVLERYVRVTAEAMKIIFTDKEFTYKVLARELRINDRKILDSAYDEEI